MDPFSVGHVAARVHRNDVTETHTQILPHNLVHADLAVLQAIIGQNNAHSVLALLSLDQHVITTEEIQFLHLGLRKRDHRIVVIERLLNDQAVGRPLLRGCLCRGCGSWNTG